MRAVVLDIQIQRAAPVDAAKILELQRAAYEAEARLYADWSQPALRQTLPKLIAEFDAVTVLKALHAGDIVGSVRARLNGPTCSVGRLVVHPDFRRQGIGRQLMHEIELACPARRFELFTAARSERNIRLYESLGYRPVRAPDGVHLELVFMEKQL